MGTTCSSALNNLLQCSMQKQTTLPSWYNTAQQNILNQANTAAAAAPSFGATTGQNAVSTLTGSCSPFKQATGTLNQIASGAANPWIVNSSTGQVTPNTNTAMGGLFAAQQQQLNQLLPQETAPVAAGAIGSGNFGSLRGQTAVDTAKANALATLQAQQMTSALQNQSTGATAAANLGNVGAQCVTSNLNTATAQMNAPYLSAGNYSNLINAMNVPTTCTQQKQQSALGALTALGNSVTGVTGGLCGLYKSLTGQTGVSGTSPLGAAIGKWLGISSTGTSGTSGTQSTDNSGGSGTLYTLSDGSTTTDKNAYLADLQQQAADEQQQLSNNSGSNDSSGDNADDTTVN